MAKPGDTVRYLNSTGGGVITKIEGKMAYVDDNGFETPVLLKELVVVLPAGHEPPTKGARLMFDQKAFDTGREDVKEDPKEERKRKEASHLSVRDALAAAGEKVVEQELPEEETDHGEKLNIVLAFEPTDLKNLGQSRFNAVLVNDSNYRLSFVFLGRGGDSHGWETIYASELPANESMDVAVFTHETLGRIERVAVQFVAWKKDKTFSMKAPVSVSRRLDLTKFHKLHCFRPGVYFDDPVIEIPIVSDDVAVRPLEVDAGEVEASMGGAPVKPGRKDARRDAERLAEKYRVDAPRKPKPHDDASNPHKLLPLVEVDLHIGELTDTTSGMQPADMLGMQLDEVRKVMKAHCRRKGQKIVFIHGKGEGVLRKSVLALLKKEYPACELQDASFREYGFGATLVTVH